MTNDFIVPWETQSLVDSSKGLIYPTRIVYQYRALDELEIALRAGFADTAYRHHQLKNYISTLVDNIIYYVSGFEIYSLDVSTRARCLIKSLPWKPLCLDAAHGWIGVGGETNGQCAFIRVGELRDGRNTSHSRAEVDDLLSLNLDPQYRHARHDLRSTQHLPRTNVPRYDLQHHELGRARVNSIKIHILSDTNKAESSNETVAVITNNDQTVRIFSLSQSRTIQILDYPTPMNHASLSPDGDLLLAVGDDILPRNEIRAFFSRRIDRSSTKSKTLNHHSRYEWRKIADPKLFAEPGENPCFCTAFSPSGHICSVASQSGVLTFFDTSRIRDDIDADEAVIAVLKSSQSPLRHRYTGAVRSMCFSPAPWDLFAWAEDQGRMCVVDLRNAFHSQQTIELETEPPNVKRMEVIDYESTSEQRQLEIERRFVERSREALEAQDHLAAVSHNADYLALAEEQSRLEEEGLQSFTPSERQMIDSIGLRRPQGNGSSSSGTPTTEPVSINYTPIRRPESSTWTDIPSPLTASQLQGRSTGTASIHDFMRNRNWERSRGSERSYQPRRRSSVIISNSNTQSRPNSNRNSTPSHPSSSLAPIGSSTPTFSTSPSRLPSTNSEPSPSYLTDAYEPWQTITDAMGIPASSQDPLEQLRGTQYRELQRQSALEQRAQALVPMQLREQARERSRADHADAMEAIAYRAREFNARTQRHLRTSRVADAVTNEIDREVLSRRLDEPRRRARPEGVATVGVAWSNDGRYLFVGTEEGILEYPVKITARKTFPSMAFL